MRYVVLLNEGCCEKAQQPSLSVQILRKQEHKHTHAGHIVLCIRSIIYSLDTYIYCAGNMRYRREKLSVGSVRYLILPDTVHMTCVMAVAARIASICDCATAPISLSPRSFAARIRNTPAVETVSGVTRILPVSVGV